MNTLFHFSLFFFPNRLFGNTSISNIVFHSKLFAYCLCYWWDLSKCLSKFEELVLFLKKARELSNQNVVSITMWTIDCIGQTKIPSFLADLSGIHAGWKFKVNDRFKAGWSPASGGQTIIDKYSIVLDLWVWFELWTRIRARLTLHLVQQDISWDFGLTSPSPKPPP